MRETKQRPTWVRLMRVAAFGAGTLLLAGCATGYSFVQPDVAGSGGYYTGQEPYSGQGYYDDYGTGPYYPGTSGYGYYNGSYPYSNPYGYYGGNYGYGPQWLFNVGISSVWDFPGYWGPWYTTSFPLWGCYSWRCGYRHHRHRHGQGHDHDGSKSWLEPDDVAIPPRLARGTPPVRVPSRPVAQQPDEGFANRGPVSAANFQHDRFVHAPRRHVDERFIETPAGPTYSQRVPDESTFVDSRALPAELPMTVPHGPRYAPRMSPTPNFRQSPSASAARPIAPSPSRRNDPSRTKRQ